MINITLYRAKRTGKGEYIIGFLIKSFDKYYIGNDRASGICDSEGGIVLGYDISYEYADAWEIDPTTLAIHFPDMLDSQGNKIFASLSEDGKGGDIMKDEEYYGIAKYKDNRFVVEYENVEECLFEGNFEIIGIQE